jgi:hypothetical protein
VVRLTADDPPQVRWTLVIRYGGEDRWRLEGVQVGGRGAKRGFFGVSAVSELGESSFLLVLARSCSFLLVLARSCSFLLVLARSCSFLLVPLSRTCCSGWGWLSVRLLTRHV